jgi:hypothetical protein
LAAKNVVIHSAMGGLKTSVKNYGIIFNLKELASVEYEKVYAEILKYDESLLDAAYIDTKLRFSNIRRREDFKKMFG